MGEGAGRAGPSSDGARRQRWPRERVGAFAGALSTAVGLGAVLSAVAVSPWFDWSENALSDLGHPRHPSAPIFGAGLAASGLLYLVFVWGLERATPVAPAGRAAVLLLGAGGASLAGVGAINESFGPAHFLVSLAYFTFVPLGMLAFARSLSARRKAFSAVTVALALAAGAFGTSILTAIAYGSPFPSQAVPELLASAVLAGWSLLTAAQLLRGRLAQPAS